MTTPKKKKRKRSGIENEMVVALSLQEASTWIRQAYTALDDMEGTQVTKDKDALEKISRALPVIHNRYSRVKMSR